MVEGRQSRVSNMKISIFLGVILLWFVRVSLEQEEYNIYIAQFSLQSLFNNNTILFANGTKIPQQ